MLSTIKTLLSKNAFNSLCSGVAIFTLMTSQTFADYGHSASKRTTKTFGNVQQAVQLREEITGRWHVRHTVDGLDIEIFAKFDAQGDMEFQFISHIDSENSESNTITGTYKVRGNTLVVKSEGKVEKLKFRFLKANLQIDFGNELSLTFDRIS